MASDATRRALFSASMKHSKIHIKSGKTLATILLWLAPLLLVVPNIILDFTEISYNGWIRTANIAIPVGVYLVALAMWRRNGITLLCMLPIMVLCCFQIVLLFLYGESIIAIDMFLNVVTTNVGEASELLDNLTVPIITVVIIYLPLIVLAIVATAKKSRLSDDSRIAGLITGSAAIAIGIICGICCTYTTDIHYTPSRQLFPVNVCHNIVIAGERTEQTLHYNDASAPYTFYARSTHAADEPEIYVMVIGETSRADNWQLAGYERPTTPRLSERQNLVYFRHVLSESNTTHKSVPLMLSHIGCDQFADSIYCIHSIIDAFGEAGYSTTWISNQQHNGALIDFMGERAHNANFLCDDGGQHYDMEVCSALRHTLATDSAARKFIVIHTYGSHFNYTERYPADFEPFGHVADDSASPENRGNLMRAYDNSIAYTDAVLDSIISIIDAQSCPAAMIYASDHGEDIYDDARGRFLHASPTPTYCQLHVPMVLWMSDQYKANNYDKYARAIRHSTDDIASSRSVSHTLLSLADIDTPIYSATDAITDEAFRSPERMYLNDYNEAVPLQYSGLRRPDFERLTAHNISYK